MIRIQEKLTRRRSDLMLWIRPRLLAMPLPMQAYDDPFLPFGRAVIAASRDLVAGYVFDLAAYGALGAAGIVALERTIPYANEETMTVLNGPFASPDYSEMAGVGALNVDAVTVTDAEFAKAYLEAGVGVFAMQGDGSIGTYSLSEQRFTLGDVTLRNLGDDVLYASRREDFTDALRAAIQAHLP